VILPLLIALAGSGAVADHVALKVADPARSVGFYHQYFGLQQIRVEVNGPVKWMQAGPIELHLIGGRTEPSSAPIDVHLALRVTDLDALIARLDADHITWSDSAHHVHQEQVRNDKVRQIYLQDPDGYWVEVNQKP